MSGQNVKRSPRRLLKGIMFLCITGGILAFLVYSPLFTLQNIDVKGNVYLTPEEIAGIARVEKGEPIFQLETQEVTEHLLKDLRIETVAVKRILPGTLSIELKERMPVATVAAEYGFVDFDRQGKVIASYRNLKNVPIPLITGTAVRDLYIGDDNVDENIRLVLEYLQKLDQATLNQISEVNAGRPEAIIAYTSKAVPIRLGNLKERMEEKAALTIDFIKDQETSPYVVEYIDFSYQAPFIKLKELPPDKKAREGTGI